MSTMLSDKSEQLGAGSVGTMTVEVTEIPVGSSLGGDGGSGGQGVATNTKQVLSDVAPAVKADAQELKFMTEDYIIEQPLKAVGIAMGVGFVLGVLWCRRR